MIDSIVSLWKKNKILFFLLLPLGLMAVGIKFYQEYQFGMAKRSLTKAKKESAERKKKIAKQEKAAKALIEKADEASDRRKAREESDKLNLDWHKKDKK
jgi:hypothetical protein